jgi:hypothetical protein
VEYLAQQHLNASKPVSGILGGMLGGIAQAYTTMGFCTFMKTVEVTRHKNPDVAVSTFKIASDIFKKEGIVGLNKGVSAVALRQMTNWGNLLRILKRKYRISYFKNTIIGTSKEPIDCIRTYFCFRCWRSFSVLESTY